MLFCSATTNKVSMFYSSVILHPRSIYNLAKDFPADMGLDNPTMKLPIIDPILSKFFTLIVWGNIGRDGIDVVVEFTTN